MTSLQKTLKEYQDKFKVSIKAGDSPADVTDDFIRRIKVISGHNRIFLWINVAMLLLVFIGSSFLVYYFIDDLDKLKIVFGATGITIAGMIYYMTYLWRQIVGIDLAIALSDRLDNNALPAIINSLLATVGKKEKE